MAGINLNIHRDRDDVLDKLSAGFHNCEPDTRWLTVETNSSSVTYFFRDEDEENEVRRTLNALTGADEAMREAMTRCGELANRRLADPDYAARVHATMGILRRALMGHAPDANKDPAECPECEGDGEWERVVGEDRGGMGGISPITRTVRCEDCDGEGLAACDECGERPSYKTDAGPRCETCDLADMEDES